METAISEANSHHDDHFCLSVARETGQRRAEDFGNCGGLRGGALVGCAFVSHLYWRFPSFSPRSGQSLLLFMPWKSRFVDDNVDSDGTDLILNGGQVRRSFPNMPLTGLGIPLMKIFWKNRNPYPLLKIFAAMADREGFEPSVPVRIRTLSRGVVSASSPTCPSESGIIND